MDGPPVILPAEAVQAKGEQRFEPGSRDVQVVRRGPFAAGSVRDLAARVAGRARSATTAAARLEQAKGGGIEHGVLAPPPPLAGVVADVRGATLCALDGQHEPAMGAGQGARLVSQGTSLTGCRDCKP
jgi:hypothetical protein